jgi:hypothetical protein
VRDEEQPDRRSGVTEEAAAGIRIDEVGIHGLHLMEDGRTTRVVVTEKKPTGRRAHPGGPRQGADRGLWHPFRGPQSDVVTADGPLRVFTLLHDGDATYDGGWELPVIGSVSAPAAVLIRPAVRTPSRSAFHTQSISGATDSKGADH